MGPEKIGNRRKHNFPPRVGPRKTASLHTRHEALRRRKRGTGKVLWAAGTAAVWEGEVKEDWGAWGRVEGKGK